MLNRFLILVLLAASLLLNGCASVPMDTAENDAAKKAFSSPAQDTAGLYIYRNSNFGGALKKSVSINGEVIGETAPMTFFYRDIKPGKHTISTESEFSDNEIELVAEGGKNYFIRQYIKMGVFVGGANLQLVSEDKGKQGVLECNLAKSN